MLLTFWHESRKDHKTGLNQFQHLWGGCLFYWFPMVVFRNYCLKLYCGNEKQYKLRKLKNSFFYVGTSQRCSFILFFKAILINRNVIQPLIILNKFPPLCLGSSYVIFFLHSNYTFGFRASPTLPRSHFQDFYLAIFSVQNWRICKIWTAEQARSLLDHGDPPSCKIVWCVKSTEV